MLLTIKVSWLFTIYIGSINITRLSVRSYNHLNWKIICRYLLSITAIMSDKNLKKLTDLVK